VGRTTMLAFQVSVLQKFREFVPKIVALVANFDILTTSGILPRRRERPPLSCCRVSGQDNKLTAAWYRLQPQVGVGGSSSITGGTVQR
jgi:hypothetical protein